MPDSRLHRLSRLGQSVWIDYLSRDLLHTGGLARMMDADAVTGVTSNPTIFQKAISQGSAYDDQLRDLVEHEEDAKEIFVALAGRDIGEACDLMRKVWDGGRGLAGYVSMEVDPALAYDTGGTLVEARRLHTLIDKPNLYVKIPGTEPGLPAIEEMIAAGKSINVTLIFSFERHRDVMEAYIRGIERLVSAGGDPRPVSSVASFFVSASTPRPTSGSTRSGATTTLRADSRSPTRSSPTRTGRRSSPGSAGGRSRRRAPRSSGACGPRPRRRTPPIATSSTSRT
jgi:transaldolase